MIDNILLGTKATLDNVQPAQLSKVETGAFGRILSALPESILPDEPVADVRAHARDAHDQLSEIEISDDVAMPEEETFAPVTNMFRIFRNGKIMGQVLRTKHGSLNIKKLNEIVETIAEAGLRLITLSLLDEQQINRIKELMRSQIKEIDLHIEDVDDEQLAMGIEYLMFMWILINIQQIVHCINVPEIDDIVKNIVARKNSVAFDLIGYCAMLESAPKLTWRERRALAALLDKHDNVFVKRVLSFATQGYMGTHTSDAPVEQSICALLGIKYMARPNAGR